VSWFRRSCWHRRDDRGAAVPEFLMVSIVLIFLVMLIMQAILYLYIRSVVVASAAEGARYAANADANPQGGGELASDRIAGGTSNAVAAEIACEGSEQPGEAGATVVQVRCSGELPLFFAPMGNVLPLDVRAQALKEGG